ncbi:MAG: SDR family oxidoreductase [Flavobacteriaceae bacterium]|jgi:NAD(P)-dependent dehydrogenase (short-subunit alcohol dehydrogenase family)|nr:SDR family oxidoreductase [Flavobacteriaceae bacterium]
MSSLANKVSIITGGASGIGKACAELFIKEGARVTISDLNEEYGKKVVEQLGENSFFVKADSSSVDDNKRIVEETLNKFGALHIAVNNAGIGGESAKSAEMSIEGWKKVIDINLNGVFYGMHAQIPAIMKSGGGSIVNMASILGAVGFANSSAYSAAKHGVVGLTQTAAWEYATLGIRINAVGPGFISTPLVNNALDNNALAYLETQHALQRLGKAEEVAELVLWLASDKSSFATGTYYPIDGGYLAR